MKDELGNDESAGGRAEADERTAPQAPRARPSILRALKHRNYRLYFGGQLVSLVGTWMQSVAQAWLVYRITGSTLALGFVAFASQIPVFLLATFGGAVADRFDRHRVIVVTQTTSMALAFALAALTLGGRIEEWHVFAFAAAFGVVNAFDIPARQAFVADLVGREDLLNAIALNSSMFNGARIVGPAVAGILVGLVGEGWCFLANAVSYVAVLAGLLSMTVAPRKRAAEEGAAPTASAVFDGFRFVARNKPVRDLLIVLGVVSLMGMPYSVLMPVFAAEILRGGPSSLGMLTGAAGTGAIVGALSLARREGLKGLGSWVVMAMATFGVAVSLFAFSTSFWLSVVLLVPVGFAMMVQMASSNTLIQAMVPDDLRGRVMSIYSMVFMGMAPFGSLWAGALAGRVGAPLTVAIGGAVCVVGSILFALRLPALRPEARRLVVAQQMTGGDPPEELTAGSMTSGPAQTAARAS